MPLVAINTPDPASTIRAIAKAFGSNGTPVPMVQWDVCRGVQAINEAGREVAMMTGDGEEDMTIGQPVVFLNKAADYPDGTIAFVLNAQAYWDASPAVPQGCWNLRDQYKANRRMLVLLGGDVQPPSCLKDDIVLLDEPLPNDEELTAIVKECDGQRIEGRLSKMLEESAVEAVRGLSAFSAEQAVAMALRKTGIDLEHLWEAKRKQVELTKGLSVWRGDECFGDIGGLDFIKGFLKKLSGGKRPPNAVVWIDEIEKMVAGSSGPSGDTSGVSQGILGAMLTAMQDQNARGVILLGPPGCLDGDTLIYDPVDGTEISIRDRYAIGKPFSVVSRNTFGDDCVATATPPVRYDPVTMIRFRFADGKTITVTKNHRFYLGGGEYIYASEVYERIQEVGVFLLPTISDNGQRVLLQGAPRLKKTTLDCSTDYPVCSCFCGGLLHRALSIVQDIFPSLTCAPLQCGALLRMGGLVDKLLHIHHRQHVGHLSMLDWFSRSRMRSWVGIGRWIVGEHFGCGGNWCGVGLRPALLSGQIGINQRLVSPEILSNLGVPVVSTAMIGGGSGQQFRGVLQSTRLCRDVFFQLCTYQRTILRHLWALFSLALFGSFGKVDTGAKYNDSRKTTIVQAEVVGSKEYFDFHVPVYNNYYACGCFHHNCGKSLVAKAVGKEAGVPTIAWDSNAMKGSLVGSSENAVRTALKVISAVSSDNALWIATCNSIKGIPTALRRRFSFGTYYFDLPSAIERKAIWNYYIPKYKLTSAQAKDKKVRPDDSQWTGAEIKTCCDLAWNLDCSLVESSRYFVPVAQAAPKELEDLRAEAEGRYLSASSGQVYTRKASNKRARLLDV